MIRIGIGYDVHAFTKNRELILGGIKVNYEYGLEGHSDADVLTHAIIDAILGALNKGDIGNLFPDNDPKLKDINSMILLDKVINIMNKENFKINNIDTILILEEPKIFKIKDKIKSNLSKKMKIKEDQINIKATTNEKLGFIGEKKGINAQAIALLEKKD